MKNALYKDTLTVKLTETGWVAKLHGYPFFWEADTAEECLKNAGHAIDAFQKESARLKEMMANKDKSDDE